MFNKKKKLNGHPHHKQNPSLAMIVSRSHVETTTEMLEIVNMINL